MGSTTASAPGDTMHRQPQEPARDDDAYLLRMTAAHDANRDGPRPF